MVSKAETIAITQALLALSAALRETQRTLLLLTPPEGDEFLKHIAAAGLANDRCLERIQELVELLNTGHG